MASKVRKATPEEIATYKATGALYPLSHWVTVDGHTCAVERLPNYGGDDPAFEIMLPRGVHSKFENIHTLLCDNISDVRERAAGTTLSPCGPHCR